MNYINLGLISCIPAKFSEPLFSYTRPKGSKPFLLPIFDTLSSYSSPSHSNEMVALAIDTGTYFIFMKITGVYCILLDILDGSGYYSITCITTCDFVRINNV
jgi:hypothetical protein